MMSFVGSGDVKDQLFIIRKLLDSFQSNTYRHPELDILSLRLTIKPLKPIIKPVQLWDPNNVLYN